VDECSLKSLWIARQMKISELHASLHPRLGTYSGSPDQYAYTLSADLSVLLERQSDQSWLVSMMERGYATSSSAYQSESQACAAFLALLEKTQ
jgi:hypothetical protein